MATKKAPPKAPKKASPKSTGMMPVEDPKWRAEDDARTLMRAQEILADKQRLSKAKTVAKEQADAAAKVAKIGKA